MLIIKYSLQNKYTAKIVKIIKPVKESFFYLGIDMMPTSQCYEATQPRNGKLLADNT